MSGRSTIPIRLERQFAFVIRPYSRDWRLADHTFSDAPHHEPIHTSSTLGAHHNEVDPMGCTIFEDLFSRNSLNDRRNHIKTGLGSSLMTVWGRGSWNEPMVAGSQALLIGIVMGVGASLGDILSEN